MRASFLQTNQPALEMRSRLWWELDQRVDQRVGTVIHDSFQEFMAEQASHIHRSLDTSETNGSGATWIPSYLSTISAEHVHIDGEDQVGLVVTGNSDSVDCPTVLVDCFVPDDVEIAA